MTLADLTQIMQIEKQVFSNFWSEVFFIETIEKDICYVNRLDRELIGYLVGKKFNKVFYLMNFAIKKELHHQGYGMQMMRFLLSFLIKENFDFVFLDVRESNKAASNLYKHFGFAPYRKKLNYYSSPVEDAVQMLLNFNWFKKL
ncbi:MAG: ribosomal protein S18-alanine N-acetyltransferase [Candidatus Cloacimonetes bacterium]|nr:ribosomal protein S18-alanine N-acetyltransferase [Candidatus Cloacimonadota bacterium]